ncbi:MAG: division/cell wall cluster transcriptional repressor MraZ [Dinghuibacter sp.]|nr:division/cell wall cluster transcriptional repressor MraZ [Dinghuibacter sp.]
MKGFLTECEVTLDAKGRFLLPAGIKKKLPAEEGNAFVIARGFEENLVLYPAHTWQENVQSKLDKLSDFNPEVRRFKRLFLNGATELEMDSAGRVLIPKTLMEYAGLSKEAILFAEGGKIEIWDKSKYRKFFETAKPDEAGELAHKLLGGDLNIQL